MRTVRTKKETQKIDLFIVSPSTKSSLIIENHRETPMPISKRDGKLSGIPLHTSNECGE